MHVCFDKGKGGGICIHKTPYTHSPHTHTDTHRTHTHTYTYDLPCTHTLTHTQTGGHEHLAVDVCVLHKGSKSVIRAPN